jgi:hypothetical protein
MKKVYNVDSIPSVKSISDYFNDPRKNLPTRIMDDLNNVLEGTEKLDREVKLKTSELQNTKQILAQKEQLILQKDKNLETLKESGVVDVKTVFIDSLHKLYPDAYSANFEEWSDKLPMKKHVVNNDIQVMEKNIKIYKKLLEEKEPENIKKEFIKSLNELYPDSYSTDPTKWFYKDGKALPMKEHYDKNHFEVMKKNIKFYKKQLEEKQVKALEEVKILKEENLKKEKLLVQKDELLLAKELENQKLLIQKEEEVHNKSLAKNQLINELQDDVGLKEKETLNLKIESLTKQVEFHKKESEFKDKALEDALEIGKQNKIISELKEKELADARAINELQGKLLDLKALYGHDISFSEQFSAIQFRAENSIANNDFGDIQDLSRYISELLDAERENSPSMDLSKLLSLNESPVLHVQENHVEHPIAVVNNGNFDIDKQHITHSVLLNGEGSESFEII